MIAIILLLSWAHVTPASLGDSPLATAESPVRTSAGGSTRRRETEVHAQHELLTIQDTGPSENRIDFVIVGDGFTSSQLDTQEAELRRAAENVMQYEPFADYRPYFNIHLIKTVSPVEGIGNGSGIGTFYGCYYNCGGLDRLTCCNSQTVQSTVDTIAPDNDVILVMINSQHFGGSGGYIATSTLTADDVPPHEFGHTFGGLADEYAYYSAQRKVKLGRGWSDFGEQLVRQRAPNCTTTPSHGQIGWDHWIEPSTPLPTTNNTSDLVPIGAFEGCQYKQTGTWRPVYNCLMRSLGKVLCPVCAEAMVLSYYELVELIDEKRPSAELVSGADDDVIKLAVSGVQTASNSVETEWTIDGDLVPDVTGNAIEFPINCLEPGEHQVVVTLHDATPRVIKDPQGLASASANWTVLRTDDGEVDGDCNIVEVNDDDDDDSSDDDDSTGDDDDSSDGDDSTGDDDDSSDGDDSTGDDDDSSDDDDSTGDDDDSSDGDDDDGDSDSVDPDGDDKDDDGNSPPAHNDNNVGTGCGCSTGARGGPGPSYLIAFVFLGGWIRRLTAPLARFATTASAEVSERAGN